jgi:predicted nucleic acid-binding protein
MTDKIFIDSNIFLYTLDRSNKEKRDTAAELLQRAANDHRIFISTQVLNEVYAVAVRKLGVEPLDAKEFIKWLKEFDVVIISSELIESAIDCSILTRINYWDALMFAAAESAKCDLLWTEDLQHGSVVRGVRVANPFLGYIPLK